MAEKVKDVIIKKQKDKKIHAYEKQERSKFMN